MARIVNKVVFLVFALRDVFNYNFVQKVYIAHFSLSKTSDLIPLSIDSWIVYNQMIRGPGG